MIHNIAHRGASAYEPENTLRAFERAIQMGATMFELDIHLSRDGHLVVIHDADVSRTTTGKGHITEMTLEQIKELDAGKGEQIPTLPEVIDLARDRAKLYLELKGQRTPGPLVNVLNSTAYEDQVIVGSFYPWLIQKTKFLNPMIRTSILIRGEDREADFLEWALAVEADYVHPCWENVILTPHKLLTPDMIADIRKHNLGLIIWQEDRPSELQELVRLDVDGICTNAPDVLAAILSEQKGTK
ncbi:MAG: glycerophosphodiester phosphodiesterase [Anaerolineaceae bacterium]|nr:glycerophosphodiester phosphodiesterase [Anaerolineaceae bacterium]